MRPSKVRERILLRSLRKFTSNLKELQADSSTPQSEELRDIKPDNTANLAKRAYLKALSSLPHRTLVFYVHAYCSLVWNKMAQERLRQFGSSLAKDDMIMNENTHKVR